jgi:uncharacterized membrane protein
MNEILILILLTLAPFFELRASIPYGIFSTDFTLITILTITIITNILLAPFLYLFFNHLIHLFLKIKSIERIWNKVVLRAQKRIHKAVEKYGIFGLALFIGIPLPGSGVYTAAIGSYVLGYNFKQFFLASILGVIIAATAVTLISLFGQGFWSILI